MSELSIIMPVLDEGTGIADTLDALALLRRRGVEVIVVDGGSGDATVARARSRAARVIPAMRGRALQMNAGADIAGGDVVLFVHADTRLPPDADRLIVEGLARSGSVWGRFDVTIEGRHPLLKLVAGLMNMRSRMTGIATGDQAIFVKRDAFRSVGGFPAIPLMEDVALSKRLKKLGAPLCLTERVTASGRRWEKHGVIRTVLLMWQLRFAFFLGADPKMLARRYGYGG